MMRFLRPRNIYTFRRRWLFIGSIVLSVLFTFWILNIDTVPKKIPLVDSSRHLPLLYWYHRSTYPKEYRNFSCSRAPSPRMIKHVYPFWQLIYNPSGTVIASSAFWDDRFEFSAVRVLAYSNHEEIDHFFCQLWYFNRKDPVIVHAQNTYVWRDDIVQHLEYGDERDDEEDRLETIVEPYVLTCIVRNDSTAPAAVSLVTEQCEGASNLLKVQDAPIEDEVHDQIPGIWKGGEKSRNIPESKGVCVCSFLPPHNRDVSARLAEWMELLKHFGVEMIYLYVTTMHPNVRHVIDHYQWIGLVDLSYFSMPFAEKQTKEKTFQGSYKLGTRKKQQVIFNDCLYRAIGWHRWIMPLHLDDLLVPIRDGDLITLAERESEQNIEPQDALSFSMVRFTPRASDTIDSTKLKILDHQWRMKEEFSDDWNTRSMNRVDTVIAFQEYLPLWCGGGTLKLSDGTILEYGIKPHLCLVDKVESHAARVHAYGGNCTDCENLVRDTTMQKWQHVSEEIDDLLKYLTDN